MKFARFCLIVMMSLALAAAAMTGCRKGGTISGIEITPATPGMAKGTKMQLYATALFSSGSRYEWTSTAHWSSSNEAVAVVSNDAATHGIVTAVSNGTTIITATDLASEFTTTALLTVTKPLSLSISPVNPRMAAGAMYQFSAIATMLLSDTTTTVTQNVTTYVSWSSSNSSVASITNTPSTIGNGFVTAVAPGMTLLAAADTINSVTTSATLTVMSASLSSITVTPDNPGIAAGTTQQFTATGTFSDGSVLDITPSVNWVSSDTAVAAVSNGASSKGIATAVAAGAATITATDPITLITNNTTLTVSP